MKFIIAENFSAANYNAKEKGWQRSEWSWINSAAGCSWYKLKGHHLKSEDIIIVDYIQPELQRLIEERMS